MKIVYSLKLFLVIALFPSCSTQESFKKEMNVYGYDFTKYTKLSP